MENLSVFISICIVANLSPGPAVFLTVRNGCHYGLRSALFGILGNMSAMTCLAVVSAVGIGTIVIASPVLHTGLKITGGLYLVYLGVCAYRLKRKPCCSNKREHTFSVVCHRKLYKEALKIGLSNPKAIIFYTAFFPQFLTTEHSIPLQFIMLSSICNILSCSFLVFYAATSAKISGYLNRDIISQRLDKITGVAFTGFGLALVSL